MFSTPRFSFSILLALLTFLTLTTRVDALRVGGEPGTCQFDDVSCEVQEDGILVEWQITGNCETVEIYAGPEAFEAGDGLAEVEARAGRTLLRGACDDLMRESRVLLLVCRCDRTRTITVECEVECDQSGNGTGVDPDQCAEEALCYRPAMIQDQGPLTLPPPTSNPEAGPVIVHSTVLPNGIDVGVSAQHCGSDALLDVFIPSSQDNAIPPANIDVSQVCGEGFKVTKVCINFTSDDVIWKAVKDWVFDPSQGISPSFSTMDQKLTIIEEGPQTVVLNSPEGIERVVICQSAELCIHEICVECAETAVSPDTNEPDACYKPQSQNPGNVIQLDPSSGNLSLGHVSVHAAFAGPASPINTTLSVQECGDDAALDVKVPWTDGGAVIPAIILVNNTCPEPPTLVCIRYTSDDVFWTAKRTSTSPFQAISVADSKFKAASGDPQTVCLFNSGGIE